MEVEHAGDLSRLYNVFAQLGNREPLTLIEAQAVIENIRAEKGHLDEETSRELDKLPPRSRERLLRIVELKQETEADYTTNISEQLYSSKYRFLYELVQNADDSSYRTAKKHGASPFLRFEITPDTFIVETNEDGFSRANIEAICATGKSSKKASQTDDHIGEKGFGFKSVFSIAEEVHIQSGLWSFRFKHRKGERGLGMVTPLDCEPHVLPRDVTTRITLRYSKEARQEYSRLVEAVKDLPHTMILFLQRLQSIHINIATMDAHSERTTLRRTYDASKSRCTIGGSRNLDGTVELFDCEYLIFRDTKSNMPIDQRRKHRREAKIELAFPIDPVTQQPKLQPMGQHVFAFLPLQRLPQIQFLIQSDFITSASRESVIDCSWNHALCDGVAELFAEAVSGTFAAHDHPLKFSWLDYLPTKPMEHPWKTLCPSIVSSLKNKPTLLSRERKQFRKPGQFRHLPSITLYRDEPILPDLAEEIYLSEEYATRHEACLTSLGVETICWDEIIARLQADLAHIRSRIKTTPVTDPWHEAIADLLLSAFSKDGSTRAQKRIKQLALIPLSKPNQWTGAPGSSPGGSQEVYFAYVGGIPIPGSIPLRLLDRVASTNAKRRAFYEALGVEECQKATVFAKIQWLHQPNLVGPFSVDEDHFLFLFHHNFAVHEIRSWIQVPLDTGGKKLARLGDLYFPSNGEFDMYKLLPTQCSCANYISRSLFDAEPLSIMKNQSWKTWLARVTGARFFPPLTPSLAEVAFGKSSRVLSPALKDVLELNPKKFLGMLRAHWNVYQADADHVKEELRKCEVLCRSGNSFPLHTTYLPTIEIIAKINELGISDTAIPLLDVDDITLDESAYRSWKFLEEFGVSPKPDMNFYVLAIQAIASGSSQPDTSIVAEIYASMARMATVQDHERLRQIFDAPTIWDQNGKSWTRRNKCMTDGPEFITFKAVLERSYGGNRLLHGFFTTALGIATWTMQDVLKEIETRQSRQRFPLVAQMRDIYTFMFEKASSDNDWQLIKTAFSEKKLVLGENRTWHTLRTCLWRSPFALAGFQDLSMVYPNLEAFFVRRLGVKKASPSMLINEVKRMAEESAPRIPDIRKRLVEIGMMLTKIPKDESISRALDSLKQVDFLPKKLNRDSSVLVGVTDDFAISDHPRYGEALADHGVLLDFQVDDTQIMHTMFQHLGLTHRYLSVMVKEVSVVGDGANEEEALSRQLQAKAYGLYCCAAKYKSNKALRGDRVLFTQLSRLDIYTTDDISTNLVLALGPTPLSVQSDRSFIHHDITDDKINIYVPEGERERRSCYRSQLPKLFASILSVGGAAAFDISCILSSSLRDLDDVLLEQDIPQVEWIEKPLTVVPDEPEEFERPNTPATPVDDRAGLVLLCPPSGVITPDATPTRHGSARADVGPRVAAPVATPSQLPELIEQVVRVARRVGNTYRNAGNPAAQAQDENDQLRYFDHITTFGSRETDSSHNRKIGAVGEGYIFTLLSALNIPAFTEANWQSTIRSELVGHPGFESLTPWSGRETADLVYTDADGAFTRYLRANCDGGFPPQIQQNHNFSISPIEYYLEVKSTTGACGTRFFMSGKQYERMEGMALGFFRPNNRVYVILRVYDMLAPSVGLKCFVDPLRFKGGRLEFESELWYVNTT